jgi:DNA modification methylase
MAGRTPPTAKQSRLQVGNPWFPYYAGFSPEFVDHFLSELPEIHQRVVLDPWNGAGTTTFGASNIARHVYGFDLNPAMTIAARARLLGRDTKASLIPLSFEIIRNASIDDADPDEPLTQWMMPQSAAVFRGLEHAVHRALVTENAARASYGSWIDKTSALSAFFYVALFRAARRLLSRYASANPAWSRLPASLSARVRPSLQTVQQEFLDTVATLATVSLPQHEDDGYLGRSVTIGTADSRSLPLASKSVDAIIASPPYCTRLDYARATRIELAVLGARVSDEASLRNRLIGTTSVSNQVTGVDIRWGSACLSLLRGIRNHPSKASRGYYLSTHMQYFDGLFQSLLELDRVLRPNGRCTLVVQDSWYKELHTDLPGIVTEMCASEGWELVGRLDNSVRRTIAHLNTRSIPAARTGAVESTLVFRKPAE